ncbi:e3 ubiquitin-protein ligase ubr11 [Acrodontium crateriforme]|uniref:E3 ubiquitin-protein ligase n=1 Tax=Acrodontium crateriforme TaxID=150365 RepID=A0AAQ3M2E7_9PEZI|nr:e3 ubiquitin-protein ligase ubr11 [Acrodontium crateriforme]
MQSQLSDEHALARQLIIQPSAFGNRYSDAADRHLRQVLFRSLACGRDDYLRLFFPNGTPTNTSEPWLLSTAQEAVGGAEYTAAAKGHQCGHIVKAGESTYHCKTCSVDDTCLLCARCYEASDHEGHIVFISVSTGNSGMCDCGDPEAWRRPVHCSIHTADEQDSTTGQPSKDKDKASTEPLGSQLPPELVRSIRSTISKAMDYVCDVFSCSPEQLRLPKTKESIEKDERTSRLAGPIEEPVDPEPEYVLILWNDEKHSVDDVQNQVARACAQTKSFGLRKAQEVDDVGRSCVHYSRDLSTLLKMASIIEQIKVTVTIRSARDTFREQMCATIIDWIKDISGCVVGPEAHLLKNIVCEELFNPWRTGSQATNMDIGLAGIDDHEREDREKSSRRYAAFMHPLQGNVVRVQIEVDDVENDQVDDEDENEDYDEIDDMDMEDDDMEIEIDDIGNRRTGVTNTEADMDIDILDENEDMTEALEATLAGYPPPPPPPPPQGQRRRAGTAADSEDGETEQTRPSSNAPYENIPRTPRVIGSRSKILRPSKHWLDKPDGFRGPRPTEPCENLWQRVRIDYLILYDLRLWKNLRIDLRNLFITTVVILPHFKRILGLRIASLYTALAQLYLIADREPDHSIVNLTVQVLTTPTVTQEVVERANFLSNLMAILYTFLTTRQVGFPEDVNRKASLAFDSGTVTNRRIFHFFLDLRWLFQSEFIHYRMRVEPRYLLQFLDLVKLHQGVCPNVRATGEHVEYESEAWISASMIVKEINKLCKAVAMAFAPKADSEENNGHLERAIRTVAQVTMINSFGYERRRFHAAEAKEDLAWHLIGPFGDVDKMYSVPKHVVQSEPMSFHHALHYLLSWLLEEGKLMSREDMRRLLHFTYADLKDPFNISRAAPAPSTLTPDELLAAIFEHPLRVCVWLVQMKAGMWVRNGMTLRHQAHGYRSVANRDVGYQRDIMMVQTGLVLCGSDDEPPGERFLAQMIDRFQMTAWFNGDYSVVPGFEEPQQLDVIEDFFHLLITALSERGNLIPSRNAKEQQERILQHDVAHALCFKPLSFSDLASRVTEKVGESDDFNRVLDDMTIYRAPEGLTDTGVFELKPEYIDLVDPYYAHYSRNHREEAENIYKQHVAQKLGKKAEDVVYEPNLQPIHSGLFKTLSAVTATPLFVQVLKSALQYAVGLRVHAPNMQSTRVESFLHMVLHLTMLATIEEKDDSSNNGFSKLAASQGDETLISLLLIIYRMEEYASCHATIKAILRKMQNRQPEKLGPAIGILGGALDRAETGSPASLSADDKERKKQEALARQARVMAQMKQQQNSFLQNQGMSLFGEDYEDEDMDDMSAAEGLSVTSQQKKTLSFPSGTCILCQEETSDQRLYGTFAFLGESDILRSTPIKDPDYVEEVMDIPASLDRSAEDIRPFGVAGKNRATIQKVAAGGKVIETERHGLSKGFPHLQNAVKGPVSTSCGHIMHYSCFELYIAATQRRHTQQIARSHPENINVKEFICPLCKALGNNFIPIIWKAKECAHDHELHAAKGFPDWLTNVDHSYHADLSFLENSVLMMDRQMDEAQDSYSKRSSKYVSELFTAPLVANLQELALDPSSPTSTTPQTRLRRGYSLSTLFRMNRPDTHSGLDSPTLSPSTDQPQRMTELVRAYQRIDESLRANKLDLLPQVDGTSLNAVIPLSRSLGLSVSAFEIAHRGVASTPFGTSLLAELSEQNLTHLRILSETIESYIAVNVLRPHAINGLARSIAKRRNIITAQLFGVESEIAMIKLKDFAGFLFQDDVFLFFADWLTIMAPDVTEAAEVLQLCYWAEMVKTIFVYERLGADLTPIVGQRSTPISDAFKLAVNGMMSIGMHNVPTERNERQLQGIRIILTKQAQVFLRKAIVLMHVRYGLDFDCPPNLDAMSMDELPRLTALLHVSPMEDYFDLYTSQSTASEKLREITKRWLYQASAIVEHEDDLSISSIRVSHPAIFELVGLPKNYDTLVEECTKRKCPTTGKEVTDPAICLICGEIFCSQAVCCSNEKRKGGCYQHLERCGSTVGVFISIRKCMVLFAHGPGNGSYGHAPYLDKHGEVDPTLRRHHQLFLNRKRYDKLLRDAWLNHMIPTVISRKLEGDINPGGWETL